mmetsp:Transcript_5821/g.11882  ORF Transcript_5821/g.11882 Transcript_5821/m.11882 type:complete len:105 (-) Transcript_5821:208-522(-)
MTTREELLAEFAKLRDEARAQIAELREENGTLINDCQKWESDFVEHKKLEKEYKQELKAVAKLPTKAPGAQNGIKARSPRTSATLPPIAPSSLAKSSSGRPSLS